MNSLLRHFADNTNRQSWAGRLRQARFTLFEQLVYALLETNLPPATRHLPPATLTVLDVGGDPRYWLDAPGFAVWPIQVTLLNLWPYVVEHPRLAAVAGDGRDLSQFGDHSFDMVHSNSVIEHVGTWRDQQRMAAEIRRVGRAYFVQTPNRYFPLEPHFLLPLVQFWSPAARAWLAYHYRPGWYRTWPADQAAADARQTHLLTRAELQRLFPDGRLWSERVGPFTKSFVALCHR